MGVIWKALPGVTNWWIGLAVQFHDILYGFWVGQLTGTASFEIKLIRQLMEMRWEVLYKLSVGLIKAYNIIDREKCL